MTRPSLETRPMRILATASLIATSLVLTACGATENRTVESVHQPVVQRTDYVLDLATTGGGLAAGEAGRLRGWFDSLRLAYGDRVSVDVGDTAMAGNAINMIGAVAGTRGLTLSTRAPITQGQIAQGAVRVILSRTVATVPNCPDFHQGLLSKFNAVTAPNYGCATNASLAAMVANPEDLVRGRESGSGDNATISVNQVNTNAIGTYYGKIGQQAGQVKSETTGGK